MGESFYKVISKLSFDEAVDFLSGVAVNEVDCYGNSWLVAAIELKWFPLIEWMLKNGHSPTFCSNGASPYGACISVKDDSARLDIFRLLTSFVSSFDVDEFNELPDMCEPLIHEVVRMEDFDLLSIMLEKGASLSTMSIDGVVVWDLLPDCVKKAHRTHSPKR